MGAASCQLATRSRTDTPHTQAWWRTCRARQACPNLQEVASCPGVFPCSAGTMLCYSRGFAWMQEETQQGCVAFMWHSSPGDVLQAYWAASILWPGHTRRQSCQQLVHMPTNTPHSPHSNHTDIIHHHHTAYTANSVHMAYVHCCRRCAWELDPRKVLVGRRLAVGGFAEVFLGKYEVSGGLQRHSLCDMGKDFPGRQCLCRAAHRARRCAVENGAAVAPTRSESA